MPDENAPVPGDELANREALLGEDLPAVVPPVSGSNKQTAIKARTMLLQTDPEFKVPTPRQKRILLIEFARKGRVIYGQAFDLIKVPLVVDLDDPASVQTHLESISLIEVKSTNRSLPPNFEGFFFSLSTAELLTAQSLGARYRFAFVNVVTGKHLELALPELFGRARSIYPTWSIRF
jgi:hypothetical protein